MTHLKKSEKSIDIFFLLFSGFWIGFSELHKKIQIFSYVVSMEKKYPEKNPEKDPKNIPKNIRFFSDFFRRT